MDRLENSQRGSTKNNKQTKKKKKRFGSRRLIIEKAEDELCAKRRMTEERHNIYKYIRTVSEQAGINYLQSVGTEIVVNAAAGKKIGGINGKKMKIALGRAMGPPL